MKTTQDRRRAAPATPEKYLWLKPNARHLWFRYSVPTRYRAVEPKKLIQRSLGTNDRWQASVLAARWRVELHEQWEALISPDGKADVSDSLAPLTEPNLIELQVAAAEAAYLSVRQRLTSLRLSKGIRSSEGYDSFLRSMKQQLMRLVRTRDTDARHLWEGIADRLVASNRWILPRDGERYAALVGMIAEAGIEALRVDLQHNEGDVGAEPTSKTVREGLQASKLKAAPGETLLELFDLYAAQKTAEKRKRPDTLAQDRKAIERLSQFVGPDRSLRSIGRVDTRDWRNTLVALPLGYGKAKAYSDLTMREAAATSTAAGAAVLNPLTVNKYLSAASALFAWCITNSYLDSNPCDGLFYDLQKGKNPHPPFTADQLRKILASPLFTGFQRDGIEHRPGNVRAHDWRYWIPLVCLFTGARIGEIAQLNVDDIAEEDGIWFFQIRNDEETGQQTKSGHSRPAAMHPKLREVGFLEFVSKQQERATQTGQRRLFPELAMNEREQIGAKPSRFWRRYLQKIRVKQGSDGMGAHSFRHLMADQLRQAGYLDNQIEVALGHNQKTVTGGYGRVKQGTIKMLNEMMEAVRFEGISFDTLIPQPLPRG